MKIFSIIASISVLSCSATPKKNSPSRTQFIHGENDLVYYNTVDQISSSIGQMQLGCTVTHIGQGVVITAGHCVDESDCQGDRYNVRWGVLEHAPNGVSESKCLKVLAVEDEYFGSDYAVLLYDRPPQHSLIVQKETIPEVSEKLTMYSHANNQSLQWSNWCTHIQDEFNVHRYLHMCDAEGGSSGAPMFNAKMQIIGIHNGGSGRGNYATWVHKIPYFTTQN